MGRMHNPAHPGEVLRGWLPEDMSVTRAAQELKVSRVTLSRVLNGKADVTAGMALRLGWATAEPENKAAGKIGRVACAMLWEVRDSQPRCADEHRVNHDLASVV